MANPICWSACLWGFYIDFLIGLFPLILLKAFQIHKYKVINANVSMINIHPCAGATRWSSLYLTTYQREFWGLLLRGCGGDSRVLALLQLFRLQSSSSAEVKAVQRDKLLQCDFAPLPCFDSLFSTREVVLQSHSSTEKHTHTHAEDGCTHAQNAHANTQILHMCKMKIEYYSKKKYRLVYIYKGS